MKTKIKKDWYGRLKSVDELYNDSKLWISEIDFVNHEIGFLDRLLRSNYINFLDAGLNKKIKNFIKKIVDEKKVGNILFKQIKDHKKVMSGLIKTNSVTSNINYLDTHKKFERDIHIYLRKYKMLKKNIFYVVENLMKKKDQKILLQ